MFIKIIAGKYYIIKLKDTICIKRGEDVLAIDKVLFGPYRNYISAASQARDYIQDTQNERR
jgi:hypothetical protein